MNGAHNQMSTNLTSTASTLPMQLARIMAILLFPFTVMGQELGEPLTGPEILPETVQIEHSLFANCALLNTGSVFCWDTRVPLISTFENFITDIASFSELNAALNNDIASITLDSVHLCGIGRVSGIACVAALGRSSSANGEVAFPPEPEASYLSISDLGPNNSPSVCGIQTDNRVVCWGSTLSGSNNIANVPPEAAFLQQVDVDFTRACGIDLNNALVCWGRSRLNGGVDAHFGDVDITTIGPVKQVSLGRLGACVIDMNDRLECFVEFSSFTDIFADVTFSSIEVSETFQFSNRNVLCYETTSGEKDCQELTVTEDSASSESILSSDADVRLISSRNGVCYISTDEVMTCTGRQGLFEQNPFPTAPQNLNVNFFSDIQAELTWARPTADPMADDFASGYEIFRDGVFIARLPVVTSFIDSNTNPDADYEVRATRGLIAGTSAFVNAEGMGSSELPLVPATPAQPTEPTTPTIPGDGSIEIELTGTVYSSSALELFYNPTQGANSALRYNILRDGALIRENSPATSQFEAGLEVNTSYLYEVEAVFDGNIVATNNITLTTFDDGSGSASAPPVALPESASPSVVNIMLSGAVYSPSALELFWNRSPVANVTYNIFRDGVLVRERSPAVSHFSGQLPPNNTFVFEVVALLDGDAVASSTIEIDTRSRSVSEPIFSGPQQSDIAPLEDTETPSTQITSDVSNLIAGTVTFSGRANDENGSGVDRVFVSVRNNDGLFYYDGAFRPEDTENFRHLNVATGTDRWTINFPLPAGTYEVTARARDSARNQNPRVRDRRTVVVLPRNNIPSADSGTFVQGNALVFPDDGYYQVQTADGSRNICEGERSCEVPDGTYIVINHSTGGRFDNIVVGIGGTAGSSRSGSASGN